MSYKQIIILVLGLLFPFVAFPQTDVALDPEFGGRVSVAVDKKITKGLHVALEEEARFDNNFGSLDRLQTTLAVNYKVHPNVKLGMGYALINGYGAKSEAFKSPRHRFMADVMGTLHLGDWSLSLKELFQLTRRSGDFNVYQNPRNALTLKSRLKAQYKGFGRVLPYAYVEMRTSLNAPVIEAVYDGNVYVTLDDHSEVGEAGWFLTGFNGCYVNRWRGAVGVDVRLDKRNTLNFYLLGDYIMDEVVDANASGTRLKSYTKETGFRGWVGAGYEYAF